MMTSKSTRERWCSSSAAGLALLSALWATACGAHEFWLVPHDGVARSGDQVVFELRIGPTWPGVQTARLPNLFSTFMAQDSAGAQPVDGRDGAVAVGHLRVRAPGASVVALRTNPAFLQLPGNEFQDYLKEEGLNEVADLRLRNGLQNAPSREMFSRCAKSIIIVDGSSKGFDRVSNLPLELIPITDPLRFVPKSLYAVRLVLNGQPLQGALIKAQLKGSSPIEVAAVSDHDGIVRLALPGPGLWLFNAVHMESTMENSADWESLWASLTVNIS